MLETSVVTRLAHRLAASDRRSGSPRSAEQQKMLFLIGPVISALGLVPELLEAQAVLNVLVPKLDEYEDYDELHQRVYGEPDRVLGLLAEVRATLDTVAFPFEHAVAELSGLSLLLIDPVIPRIVT